MKFKELHGRKCKLNSVLVFRSRMIYISQATLLFLSKLSVLFSHVRVSCSLTELTVLYSHGSPLDFIVVVSISDVPTNVRFHCMCCRDYVRRELDAVTSSGVSSTVSKVIHDSLGFN